MSGLAPPLRGLLALGEPAAIVTIAEALGSTPREAGATMVVSACASLGTIGGGQLEFHAIDVARALLAAGEDRCEAPLTLGPQMGQCCGGRVLLDIRRATPADVDILAARDAALLAARPAVLVFGAGHTGKALARHLALLPLRTLLIDDRAEALDGLPPAIETRRLDDPVGAVTEAPPRAAFVVMTHSHALDYRIAEAALVRGDAAHVGLIGSASKRARFLASLKRTAPEASLLPFVCPIGGNSVRDKRPEVIAALAVADIVRAVFSPVIPGRLAESSPESTIGRPGSVRGFRFSAALRPE
mgnify:CR=1 FL=1